MSTEPAPAPDVQRATRRRLLASSALNGVFQGLTSVQDIVATKALHATPWQLTALAMLSPVTNMTSIWWGRVLERSGHHASWFLVAGVFGRLVLVSGLWLATMDQFLAVLAMVFLFQGLVIPATNTVYQCNVPRERRSRVFGALVSVATFTMLGTVIAAGPALDRDDSLFRWLMVAAGLAGFLATVALATIRLPARASPPRGPLKLSNVLLSPIRRSLEVLGRNREFARFERSFMLYGMGFLVVAPVVPVLLVHRLHLSYTANFWLKGVVAQLGLLLLSPWLGRLHDRWHPHRFASGSFLLLAGYPALLAGATAAAGAGRSGVAVGLTVVAYLLYSAAMAGVNVAWSMSSLHFAGGEDSAMYQSVHVTLSGVRGFLAPVLGTVLYEAAGMEAVFVTATGFLLAAAAASGRDWARVAASAPGASGPGTGGPACAAPSPSR